MRAGGRFAMVALNGLAAATLAACALIESFDGFTGKTTGTPDAADGPSDRDGQAPTSDAGVSCSTSQASAVGPYIAQCPFAGTIDAGESLHIAFPNLPLAGSLLVAIVAESDGNPMQIMAPDEWTENPTCEAVRLGSNGLRFFEKTATGNEQTLTFLSDPDASPMPTGLAIALYEIRGPASPPALDGCAVNLDPKMSGSATTMTASYTPMGANELALAAALTSTSPLPGPPMLSPVGWSLDGFYTSAQYTSLAAAHQTALTHGSAPVSLSFTFPEDAGLDAPPIYQQTTLALFR